MGIRLKRASGNPDMCRKTSHNEEHLAHAEHTRVPIFCVTTRFRVHPDMAQLSGLRIASKRMALCIHKESLRATDL
jgi:hypothetical protein